MEAMTRITIPASPTLSDRIREGRSMVARCESRLPVDWRSIEAPDMRTEVAIANLRYWRERLSGLLRAQAALSHEDDDE